MRVANSEGINVRKQNKTNGTCESDCTFKEPQLKAPESEMRVTGKDGGGDGYSLPYLPWISTPIRLLIHLKG